MNAKTFMATLSCNGRLEAPKTPASKVVMDVREIWQDGKWVTVRYQYQPGVECTKWEVVK